MAETSWNPTDVAVRDPLTGAYSRAFLHDKLSSVIDQTELEKGTFTLGLIDLDFFKSINDAFGHAHGDRVLQDFVHRVQTVSRQSDLLFRYGGDEFLLLLPHASKSEAIASVKRILDSVQSTPIDQTSSFTLSISIGIASYPEDASSSEALIEVADRNCYEAKRRGRGRFFACSTETEDVRKSEDISRLIERDGALAQFQYFLQRLPEKNRGILGILGTPGSGRTCLLNHFSTLAQMHNFAVTSLFADPALKSEAFGLCRNTSTLADIFTHNGCESLKTYFLDRAAVEGVRGFIVSLDNLTSSDHATIHLLRQCLSAPGFPCFGLIYTTEPENAHWMDDSDVFLNETVYLHPFSPQGARAFVRSKLSWEPESAFFEWLYRESRGLPGLLSGGIAILIKQGILQFAGEYGWTVHNAYQSINLNDYLGRTPQKQKTYLPHPLTDFIGRSAEIDQVNELLNDHRLVTLTGPGGIGKTRLAIEVGYSRLGDFSDGVYFVPLASIGWPDELPFAIAKALGIQETVGQSILTSVKENLRHRHCLLILDNFEQIVEASPLLSDLLASDNLLTLLVTSRELLQIQGERNFIVPPLELASSGDCQSLERFSKQSAITLFTLRAQSVQAGFALTDENAADVAELCANLEGIPLAIELAAANISILTPAEMVKKSLNRLAWLNNGPRDLPERQKTLRGIVEWSFNLLTMDEQRLFAYLAVFSAGFTIEAVEYVIKDKLTELGVTEGINALIQKSLVMKVMLLGGEPARYEMLETIREYASERLNWFGEEPLARRRHADYLLQLAKEAVKNYFGPDQLLWINRIERDHANFRAAMDWAHYTGKKSIEIKLAVAISPFWDARGYWSEGYSRLSELVVRVQETAPLAELSQLYHWGGWFANQLGHCETAQEWLEKGLKIALEIGSCHGQAWLLYRLGWTTYILGDFRKGVCLWESSLELFRSLGDRVGVAIVLKDLGRAVFYFGDHRLCETYCNESLAISGELGYKTGIARALRWLGEVARADGHYDRAMELFSTSFQCSQELDDKYEMANTLFSRAELFRSQKSFEQAADLYSQHNALCHELGYKPGIAYSTIDLGEVYRYQGKFDQAMEQYKVGLAMLEEIGDKSRMTWVYRNIAEIAFVQEQTSQAATYLRKSLGLLGERSHFMLIPLVVQGLAQTAINEGKPERAARLLGTIEAQMNAIQTQISLNDWEGYERRISAVRELLGEVELKRFSAEGHAMSLAETVAYALEVEPGDTESSIDTA